VYPHKHIGRKPFFNGFQTGERHHGIVIVGYDPGIFILAFYIKDLLQINAADFISRFNE
jgi:hypothetical protein